MADAQRGWKSRIIFDPLFRGGDAVKNSAWIRLRRAFLHQPPASTSVSHFTRLPPYPYAMPDISISTPLGSSPHDSRPWTGRKRPEQRTALACTFCRLPSPQLRRSAIVFFRDNYANSLLCFLPPQQLVDDPAGEQLPLPLLLCILALTSRFLPGHTSSSTDGAGVISHYDYTEWARREVDRLSLSSQPSITTIQCHLILCVVEVGDGLEHPAWLRVGHAVRLAQLARLHKEDLDQTSFNWGSPRPVFVATDLEARRRTFWCIYCLDRLLANGRDRIASFSVEDITTRLPQPDEDFIFGRECKAGRLTDPVGRAQGMTDGPESLLAYTIRIIDILGNIVLWHGRGGRRRDTRSPWLVDTPFNLYANALAAWKERLPIYWDYQPRNVPLVAAAGQGKLWALMFMFYFQAKTYLYREYLPFTPSRNYDPAAGPSDGTPLLPPDSVPPPSWWRDYAITMVESANSAADLYTRMHDLDLAPSAYPFTGLSLFTAASIHAIFTSFEWESLSPFVSRMSARKYLSVSMRAFNSLGQYWDLPIYWIRQISLYYKLNYLTRLSFVGGAETLSALRMNIQEVKDGVMNYLRQISPKDRSSRLMNLKPTFDFEGWLLAIESQSTRRDSHPHEDVNMTSEFEHPGRRSGDDTTATHSAPNDIPPPTTLAAPDSTSVMVSTSETEQQPPIRMEVLPLEDLFRAGAFLPSDGWDDLSLEAVYWDC
ncbi:hypothetical protein A1O1_06357 [Capronia coronata CBS 617.96]|uniref:Xylanolytic transcriptional activator regulatory domain-containing protein n=1 Tax=Capronia coronata CBS 617.96 TaxID=1182541 RepID=W9Y0J1_9EURO|nr:uncharacterized protein A1O1_06357 [Capronia coronata CBS 617.96]EXJ85988.1 hypothetical protein A1O1_06357 [Capronia coronata CBS 617.96]